jgi:hypothetical protein
MHTAKRCYNNDKSMCAFTKMNGKEEREKEKQSFTCSFSARQLGRCAANPSALHVLAWHHACLPGEDAEEHS